MEFSSTGLLPAVAAVSKAFDYPRPLPTPWRRCNSCPGPATPRQQHLHAVTLPRFRLTPVRSPLLRGSRLLLFLRVLRCFSFPGYLYRSYVFRPE